MALRILLVSIWFILVEGNLEVLYQWNVFKFAIPDGYPIDPEYSENNTVMTGMEIGKDRIYIGTPRVLHGIPSTLSWVPKSPSEESPELQAYPDWSWHQKASERNIDCDNLVSVYRMRLDLCGNLWVIDTGINDTIAINIVCPPRIFIFDTKTDQLVKKIEVPRSLLKDNSLLTNIILHSSNCHDTTAIITDTNAYAIIVYTSHNGRFKRFTHPKLGPDPAWTTFSLFGDSFYLPDGILAMAIRGKLYFQSFAARQIHSIDMRYLSRNELRVDFVANTSSQSASLDFDVDGILIYSNVIETNIVFLCPDGHQREVVKDVEKLQFVLDIKVKKTESQYSDVYLLSNRFQKFLTYNVDPSEVNLRIMKIRKPSRRHGK